MPKITISYRRDDSMDITGRIFDRLSSRYGREAVFRDIDSIPPGRDFREHIASSLGDSDVLMVVVGPRWMGGDRHGKPRIHSETDYVRTEVEIALGRKIPVIPLLVGGSDMPEPHELPESMRDFAYRNAVPIDSGRDFDHHMNGLIRATDQLLQDVPPTTAAAPQPAGERAAPSVAAGTTQALAPSQGGNLFFPIVGGVMTAQGVVHIAWFISNTIGWSNAGKLPEMLQSVWTYADISLGFGGLVIGIGTILARTWARLAGIILCLLGAFGHTLWFVEFFDKDIERIIVVATAFGLPLFILGAYLYAFRWPETAGK